MRSLVSMSSAFEYLLIFCLVGCLIESFVAASDFVRDLTGRSDDE